MLQSNQGSGSPYCSQRKVCDLLLFFLFFVFFWGEGRGGGGVTSHPSPNPNSSAASSIQRRLLEMWITNTNPGRRSTVMELASATPLNESKFSGEQTAVTTNSLNTMGTKRKHKSADDDRMQVDSLEKGDPGSWMSETGNELQTARPTRAGVSDEVAQEFQVISIGNANIVGPQVNF